MTDDVTGEPLVLRKDDEEAPVRNLEVDVSEHPLQAEIAPQSACGDHSKTSPSTKRKKVTLMTPFIVKKAMSSRRRSRGETSECS